MLIKLFQTIFTIKRVFGNNIETKQQEPRQELKKICLLCIYREHLLCLQSNASGIFCFQKCINFEEKRVKFSRSSRQEVFLVNVVLKISSKFTVEHHAEVWFKIALWHGCSPVNLLHIFKHLFLETPLISSFQRLHNNFKFFRIALLAILAIQ